MICYSLYISSPSFQQLFTFIEKSYLTFLEPKFKVGLLPTETVLICQPNVCRNLSMSTEIIKRMDHLITHLVHMDRCASEGFESLHDRQIFTGWCLISQSSSVNSQSGDFYSGEPLRLWSLGTRWNSLEHHPQ